MKGYVKLYSTILTSSIWLESHSTLRVWITMLALADKNGEVSGSVGGLAHIANVSREDCEKALALFLAPDSDSRTTDNEGRRIEKIDGGWRVLNAEKYRDLRTETQVEWAEKKKKWREENQRKTGVSDDTSTSEDTSDKSEDKPTASSSATASSSTAVKSTVAAVRARQPEIGQGDISALSRLLITRANQGMNDNPLTPNHNPIPHGHGSSHVAAEKISQAGVDPDFAAEHVYLGAKAYKPQGRSRQIRSVGYLADGVIDAWERHEAEAAARDTSRPVESINTKLAPYRPPSSTKTANDKASRSVHNISTWLASREAAEAEVIPEEAQGGE